MSNKMPSWKKKSAGKELNEKKDETINTWDFGKKNTFFLMFVVHIQVAIRWLPDQPRKEILEPKNQWS